jgi:kinesin family protein C1
VTQLQAQVTQLQAELAIAQKRIFEADQVRRKMHNIIQELRGNIRVFCRVRPLIPSELVCVRVCARSESRVKNTLNVQSSET